MFIFQGALLACQLASRANPITKNRDLEERVRALTDQVRTSEDLRKKLEEDNNELEKVVAALGRDVERRDNAV